MDIEKDIDIDDIETEAEAVEEAVEEEPVEEIEAEVEVEVAEVNETVEESAEAAEKSGRNLRKERIGIVVSNKMSKTIVVRIQESVKHSKYGKIMKRSIKFKAHDENNECDVGDKVLIMETRPLSRDKHFRLVKILEKVK